MRRSRHKKIVLTGGAGFVGSALLNALSTQGGEMIVIDVVEKPAWLTAKTSPRITWLRGDISKPAIWRQALRGADVVFHLAATEEPYQWEKVVAEYQTNALSVVHLAETCRALRIHPHVILASSANIYGETSDPFVSEETRDNPGRIWSAHKLLAEHYLRILGLEYDLPTTAVRLANVYGPSATLDLAARVVLNQVIRQALTTGKLLLFGNRHSLRDFVYIDDVASALQVVMTVDRGCGVVLVGSGQRQTIEEVWQEIERQIEDVTRQRVIITYDEKFQLNRSEWRNFIADTTKLQRLTKWRPHVQYSRGIALTVDWFLSQLADRKTPVV